MIFSELAERVLAGDYERPLADAGFESAHARRRVSTYSKGMRQKVRIAVEIAKQVKLLHLDEPTDSDRCCAATAAFGGAVQVSVALATATPPSFTLCARFLCR